MSQPRRGGSLLNSRRQSEASTCRPAARQRTGRQGGTERDSGGGQGEVCWQLLAALVAAARNPPPVPSEVSGATSLCSAVTSLRQRRLSQAAARTCCSSERSSWTAAWRPRGGRPAPRPQPAIVTSRRGRAPTRPASAPLIAEGADVLARPPLATLCDTDSSSSASEDCTSRRRALRPRDLCMVSTAANQLPKRQARV